MLLGITEVLSPDYQRVSFSIEIMNRELIFNLMCFLLDLKCISVMNEWIHYAFLSVVQMLIYITSQPTINLIRRNASLRGFSHSVSACSSNTYLPWFSVSTGIFHAACASGLFFCMMRVSTDILCCHVASSCRDISNMRRKHKQPFTMSTLC